VRSFAAPAADPDPVTTPPPRPRPLTAEEWAWLPPEREAARTGDAAATTDVNAEPQLEAETELPPVPAPWQVVCQQCGWPNDPTWIECHHCDARLTLPPAGPGPVTAGEAAPAGVPPARWERAVRLLAVVVLLAVVAVVVLLATRGLRHPRAAVATRPIPSTGAASLVVVRPVTVTASSESGERVARNVIDRNMATYWSRHLPGTDVQPFLQFTFATPVKLTQLQVAAGASGDQFIARPRPQRIALVFDDGSSLSFTLADKRGFQKLSFPPRSVSQLRLVVLSSYPGTDLPRTSISEVKFLASP
jgi:hypothetical protein